jgi:hypothetical protein
VLQIGDVFAVLIEFYFSMGNMEKCYQVSLTFLTTTPSAHLTTLSALVRCATEEVARACEKGRRCKRASYA